MTQFGLYSQTTPRNDAAPHVANGIWITRTGISLSYGGYHFNALHGINVDAAFHVVYRAVQLLPVRNWALSAVVCFSNTPWFFNGVRIQIFPTEHLKDRAVVHERLAVLRAFQQPAWPWSPNFYGAERLAISSWESVRLGRGCVEHAGRVRYHTDDSIEIKYYDNKGRFLDKAAFSLTGDMGCEHAAASVCAVICEGPKQSFLATCFTTASGSITTNMV